MSETDRKKLREEAQAQIDGEVVARMISEFSRAFDDAYSQQTMASMFAVGPMQSFIGYAIQQGYIALPDELDRQGEPVAVKPLEWQRIGDEPEAGSVRSGRTVGWAAESVVGRYLIQIRDGSDSPWWEVTCNALVVANAEDDDEAKAAAQADYEARSRRALAPSPAIGRETVTEKMVASLLDWVRNEVLADYGVDPEVSDEDAELATSARLALEAALRSQP